MTTLLLGLVLFIEGSEGLVSLREAIGKHDRCQPLAIEWTTVRDKADFIVSTERRDAGVTSRVVLGAFAPGKSQAIVTHRSSDKEIFSGSARRTPNLAKDICLALAIAK